MSQAAPIPEPPRTPTPPPDDPQHEPTGLGLDGLGDLLSPTTMDQFDPTSLSPMRENFSSSGRRMSNSTGTPMSQPLSSVSPNSIYGSLEGSQSGTGNSIQDGKGPFNFQPQPMSLSKTPVMKSSVGQRRGHKYKHSSVSHQIFLEPIQRAPSALPNSLPIPTAVECWKSMSTEQTVRFWWSICHALIAGYTLARASGSLAQTALSHLLLYDSLGALACVVVDVLGNFEAWKRSSIRHPFGLERAEVLAGFAMSVLLLFMGMDLISHIATHALEGVGDHEPHVVHEHEHERSTMGEVDLVSLLALAATLISALGLQNHARIGRHMRFTYFSTLPSILSNPSHFLTITCSLLLLLLPLFSDMNKYLWFDKALAATIAISMCLLGGYLVHELGLMLLMSYSGRGVHEVIRDIELDPLVLAVEEAKIWQVHFGLCMANLKLRVRGTDENLARLRDRIGTLVKNKLGGGYGGGRGGLKWEATTQMIVERLGVGE